MNRNNDNIFVRMPKELYEQHKPNPLGQYGMDFSKNEVKSEENKKQRGEKMIRNFEIITGEDFKVGDKVLCINDDELDSVQKGSIYEVIVIRSDDHINIINDFHQVSFYNKNRFVKLVNKTEFVSTVEDIEWAITGFTNNYNDTIAELNMMKETLEKFKNTNVEIKFFKKTKNFFQKE